MVSRTSSVLAAESVQGPALPLQSVDNVHGSDSLPLGVLGVGDGISDDVLQEPFALFVVVKMRGWALANDDPKGPTTCRWSSGGAGLLQMMIRRDRPLENDHPEGSSSKRRNWGFQ